MSELTILQLNMGRRHIVADELRALYPRYDVMAVQEPTCRGNLVTGFGLTSRVIALGSRERRPRAAIVINNPNLDVMDLRQYTTADCVACHIKWRNVSFTLVSSYMPDGNDIERDITAVEMITACTRNVIICSDTNSWNTVWGSNRTNRRGVQLGEFIARSQLLVINDSSAIPTFSSARGHSWIDVTLASPVLANRIIDWTLRSETSSDHQAISFRLVESSFSSHGTDKGYITRRKDWSAFRSTLEGKLVDEEWDEADMDQTHDLDYRVSRITTVIRDAAEESLQHRKARVRPVPWWTPALTMMKRELYKARRSYQRCICDERRITLRDEYKSKARAYRNEVRLQKRKSWDEFIVEESSKNPWGIPYRVALGKLTPQQVIAALKCGATHATTLEETSKMFIAEIYPRDDPSQDNEEEEFIRRTTVCPPGTDLCPPWDIWDLRAAVDRQRTGRAPGLDAIDAAMLKNSIPYIEDTLLELFNDCLDRGYFPRNWKIADIRLLYKGGDKDKQLAKSYRPICLLPVMSKVLENLLLVSLRPVFSRASHPRQYGSTKGRGTVDALLRVRNDVEEKAEKYVMLLLFDITSAFDSVWWPCVLQQLQKYEAPSNLYELLRSYLQDRTLRIRGNFFEVEDSMERGCPQGSVLGPALWNLVFNELLGVLEEERFPATAYVDDLAVVVASNSRTRLKEEAERCANLVEEWCEKKKFRMAAAKTQAILLKGTTDRAHPITMVIQASRIRPSEVVTYLGIRIGRKFNVTPHLDYLRSRVALTLNGLSRIGGAFWGLRYPATMTIYKGVIVSILRYASPAWSQNLSHRQKCRLATIQRMALLRVSRSFRTVSHEAVQVLAGGIPLDLLLREDYYRYQIRRECLAALPDYLRVRIRDDPRNWKKILREDTVEDWNRRWLTTPKGATLRKYFPTVSSRLEATWVLPDYWISQILTGHGGFRAKLDQYGINIDPLCPSCGVPETAEHVVLTCTVYESLRAKLLRETGLFVLTERDLPQLMDKERYDHFKSFIYGWKEVVLPTHFSLGRRREAAPGRPPE